MIRKAFLTLIPFALLAMAGCDDDAPLDPMAASEPTAPAQHDLEYVEDVSETALATIRFEDGSNLDFIDVGGTILTVTDGGVALGRFHQVMESGRPDPVSLYEALADGQQAPPELKEAVERAGIPHSPVGDLAAEKVNYYRQDWLDSPTEWAEYHRYADVMWANRTGDDRVDYTGSLLWPQVHSRSGTIRVRVYQKYYDIWSFSWKWRRLVDRDVQSHYTLSVYIGNAFDETIRVRVTEASYDRWHLAI